MPYHLWTDGEDNNGFYVKYALPPFMSQVTNGVGCMTIQKSDDNERWLLRLYDVPWITSKPVRTVVLGSVQQINYVSDATVKAIELAALENEQTEMAQWSVAVPVYQTHTSLVDARSYEEAVAKVSALFENDTDEALANGALDMPEYMLENATAGRMKK